MSNHAARELAHESNVNFGTRMAGFLAKRIAHGWVVSVVTALLLVFTLTPTVSAQDAATTPQPAPRPAPGEQAPANESSPVLAVVAGETVTEADLLDYIFTTAGLTPQEVLERENDVPDYLSQALSAFIDEILLFNAARDAKTDETELFQQRLNDNAAELLLQTYVDLEVNAGVTQEVVQSAYNQFTAQFQPETEVRVSHILVESEAEAQDIRGQINQGTNFAELASQLSIDSQSATNGGDVGFFRRGDVVENFGNAAFALQDGQVSEPVQTELGWHLLLRVESRPEPVPTLEEISDQLAETVRRQRFEQLIDTLRQQADIEFVQGG